MQKKKKWFYRLVGIIIFLCLIYIALSFWIFHVIQKEQPKVDQQKINQMIEYIMPQLNYQDNIIQIDQLQENELLWLSLKIAYHTRNTEKSTVITNDGKSIQISADSVRDVLKNYFHTILPIDLLSLPDGVQYDSQLNCFLFNVEDVFGNFQLDFQYRIIKQEIKNNQLIMTLKATSNHEENTYLITFECENDCYFKSSEIIK